jgi:hypothetical protein
MEMLPAASGADNGRVSPSNREPPSFFDRLKTSGWKEKLVNRVPALASLRVNVPAVLRK